MNQPKPLIDLWRALMSALNTEFKRSKKPLPRVLNLNLPRPGIGARQSPNPPHRNKICNSPVASCYRSPSAS